MRVCAAGRKRRWTAAPKLSVDYAVMEHLSGAEQGQDSVALVLPLDVGWSDLGAWDSLWAASERDQAGVAAQGPALALATAGPGRTRVQEQRQRKQHVGHGEESGKGFVYVLIKHEVSKSPDNKDGIV